MSEAGRRVEASLSTAERLAVAAWPVCAICQVILPRCSERSSVQRRGPGPPKSDPGGRRKGEGPPCPRAGSAIRRASGPDRVWPRSGRCRSRPFWSVKTTRGVDSQSGPSAIHTGPSVHPLAGWRLAASRPARPLPDGPHRPWRERPPSPKARYGIAASVLAHPRPSCWGRSRTKYPCGKARRAARSVAKVRSLLARRDFLDLRNWGRYELLISHKRLDVPPARTTCSTSRRPRRS